MRHSLPTWCADRSRLRAAPSCAPVPHHLRRQPQSKGKGVYLDASLDHLEKLRTPTDISKRFCGFCYLSEERDRISSMAEFIERLTLCVVAGRLKGGDVSPLSYNAVDPSVQTPRHRLLPCSCGSNPFSPHRNSALRPVSSPFNPRRHTAAVLFTSDGLFRVYGRRESIQWLCRLWKLRWCC